MRPSCWHRPSERSEQSFLIPGCDFAWGIGGHRITDPRGGVCDHGGPCRWSDVSYCGSVPESGFLNNMPGHHGFGSAGQSTADAVAGLSVVAAIYGRGPVLRMTSGTDLAVFCISLRDSPRRATFAAAAAAHSVAFEFIDAISPADLRRGFTIENCRIDITDLRWTRHEQLDPRRQEAPLLFTEIGCAYSHIACWLIGQARKLDHVCVFEDDAIICRPLADISIPATADILYLSERVPHNSRGEMTGAGCGTEGYILSRRGILKCLEIFRVLYMPIDLQLMAHCIGSGDRFAGYRRDLDIEHCLNGRVVTEPYCRHPEHDQSQVFAINPQRIAAERDLLHRDLAALRHSTSWRVTAPARAMMTALRRTLRAGTR